MNVKNNENTYHNAIIINDSIQHKSVISYKTDSDSSWHKGRQGVTGLNKDYINRAHEKTEPKCAKNPSKNILQKYDELT